MLQRIKRIRWIQGSLITVSSFYLLAEIGIQAGCAQITEASDTPPTEQEEEIYVICAQPA